MKVLEKLKAEVISAARKIIEDDLNFGTWGNISYRGDTDRVIITPSGIPYSDLQNDDLCVVDLQGKIIDSHRKPSTELPLHVAVYRARKDVQAIVHVHSKYASTFAVARQEIPVALEEMAQVLGATVPLADYALPGTKLLGENTVAALGNGYAVLLASHGLVTAGSEPNEAILRCLVVERCARVLLYSRLLGSPVLLNEEEIVALREKYIHNYGQ